MLEGKRILLGVSGSIAAYKAAELCSGLVKKGADVRVIMTKAATKFISPITFQSLSHKSVLTDPFDEDDPTHIAHIELAQNTDLLLVAPASADIIGKFANGLADDMLTNIFLAISAMVILAPAMNTKMLENAAVQHNIQVLKDRGVLFMLSEAGKLACGVTGTGRLMEPYQIIEALELFFGALEPTQGPTLLPSPLAPTPCLSPSAPFAGRSVLVTAGGTIERLDPVRYLTNDSSGKMGFALAEAAMKLGATVTVIVGRVQVPPPPGAKIINVLSALDMYDAALSVFEQIDIVFMAAAVADYRPAAPASEKMKGKAPQRVLVLEKNPDILEELGRRKFHQFLVGFAAETEKEDDNALEKLQRKRLNMIVANNVAMPETVFGSDDNEVSIFDHDGLVERISRRTKTEIAERIVELVEIRVRSKTPASTISH